MDELEDMEDLPSSDKRDYLAVCLDRSWTDAKNELLVLDPESNREQETRRLFYERFTSPG
jgi:hypothetical protein